MSQDMEKKSVLVAMSGGVDSSVTALLLKQQGYAVTGVTFNLFPQDTPKHILDAQKAAQILSIPHFIMNLEEIFHEKIISYFIESYWKGNTPNPCSFCNKYIKFAALEEYADKLGIHFLATGHYAKLVPDPKQPGKQRLHTSADEKKSQEYFLSLIPATVLNRLIFPLSDYQKPEVRQIAHSNEMEFFGSKKDSQEICFLQNQTYISLIEKERGNHSLKQGEIIHKETGKVLAQHSGFYRYTIGQRKGLRVGGGNPLYVTETDPQSNIVFVSHRESDTWEKRLYIQILNLYEDLQEKQSYSVKIRYKSKNQEALLISWDHDSNIAILEAQEHFHAPSQGQIAVLYRNSLVCGAGEILAHPNI